MADEPLSDRTFSRMIDDLRKSIGEVTLSLLILVVSQCIFQCSIASDTASIARSLKAIVEQSTPEQEPQQ